MVLNFWPPLVLFKDHDALYLSLRRSSDRPANGGFTAPLDEPDFTKSMESNRTMDLNERTPLSASARTTIRRLPELANRDREMLYQILDEAYVCHIAFVADQDTHCIPTAHWRKDDYLYIHGSNGSRMLKALLAGAQACVAITLLDGLVLAKSAFSHSMNYRSAVIYGRFELVDGSAEKLAALDVFMDKIAEGRKEEARRGNAKEINATSVLRIALAEAAVKVSASLPSDKDEDRDLEVWTGVLPLKTTRMAPIPAESQSSITEPAYVTNWAD